MAIKLVGSSPKPPGVWGVEVEPLLIIIGLQVAETPALTRGTGLCGPLNYSGGSHQGWWGHLLLFGWVWSQAGHCYLTDLPGWLWWAGPSLTQRTEGSQSPVLPGPFTAFLIIFKINMFPHAIYICIQSIICSLIFLNITIFFRLWCSSRFPKNSLKFYNLIVSIISGLLNNTKLLEY